MPLARTIPIKNLYYLFLYAWDRFPEGSSIDVGSDESPELPNLLARVLFGGVNRLLRRGIDRGYQCREEELRSPRGTMLIGNSISNGSFARRGLTCSIDELTEDVPHNRIIKATCRTLAAHKDISPDLAPGLNSLTLRFSKVANVPLNRRLFRTLQLSRNSGHYGMIMKVCELVLDALQPDEESGKSRFASILEDEERMSRIFEAFVLNFFKHEQNKYQARAEHIDWDVLPNSLDLHFLPIMKTDVTLRSQSKIIILDAKFYKDMYQRSQGGRPKVRSGHLYQILSYLNNFEPLSGIEKEGVLLYPAVDEPEITYDYQIGGRRIRVMSVDLGSPWKQIRERVLQIC